MGKYTTGNRLTSSARGNNRQRYTTPTNRSDWHVENSFDRPWSLLQYDFNLFCHFFAFFAIFAIFRHLLGTATNPPTPCYVVSCLFGSDVAVSNSGRASPAQYFDITNNQYQFAYGSILQYPFDSKNMSIRNIFSFFLDISFFDRNNVLFFVS